MDKRISYAGYEAIISGVQGQRLGNQFLRADDAPKQSIGHYWLPWYNNATADLDTQLWFGMP